MIERESSLADLSAAEMADGFRAGRLSPRDVLEAVLSRVDVWEPSINAMYLVHRDAARLAADASAARWRAGRPLSAIDGVPVTIKENIATRGDPAPIGTAASDPTPKAADAPPAARLREAGCVIVGKTTMPDFGMLSSGLSSLHGVTRNPWRLDRNTSGSSSGAAAAAAAGYGPLHVGTDIGGSVRLPATHCGLFALKPSLGRIPIDPPYMGRVAGPMTRSVHDSALLLDVLSQPDRRDWMSLPYQRGDYASALENLSLQGLRIGLLADMGCGTPVHPEVAAVLKQAADALATAGAVVEPLESFMTPAMLDGIVRFFEARSHDEIAAMSEAQRAKILPFIVEWANWRASRFSGRDVIQAFALVQKMREAAVGAVARFDFVLSPTSPLPPYEAERHSPDDDPRDALPHIAFTVAWNMSEQPAASVNWGWSGDGLPIGVQVVGQRFDDLGVLRLARAIEKLRPPQRAWPQPPMA